MGGEGETLHTVQPLAVTAAAGPSDAERLFRQRIAAFGEFEPDSDAQSAIEDICARLDGLPLALELAAARVGPLGVHEVRARIADGERARTPRWAWSAQKPDKRGRLVVDDLLSADEQIVFERLAVFADGFDLEAASRGLRA